MDEDEDLIYIHEQQISTATQMLTAQAQGDWNRIKAPVQGAEITFQQLDIEGDGQVVKLYGVTQAGNSVLAYVHNFRPYFYVPVFAVHSDALKTSLNQQIGDGAVQHVEIVEKQTIYGYYGEDQQKFFKITTSSQKFIPKARLILEQRGMHPFESNIAFEMRFMIDLDIVGCNWITLQNCRHRRTASSHCQVEVDVDYTDLSSHAPEGEWSTTAPLRILSFDIECAGRKGIFPEPKHDGVIQIANIVTVQGQSQAFVRNIFVLGTCSHIVGSNVFSYETEEELLMAWSRFITTVDPDIVTGYNINNFDFPYMIDRAKALKLDAEFFNLGRMRDVASAIKDTRFSSKAYGQREGKEVPLEGRVILDMIQVVQRDHKLRSYTLNSVASHFLGEQKEDVPHTIITDLQNGDAQTRRRLAVYCLKDAYLPQRLLDKLMVVINYSEMARVTGVPLNYLLSRGQQIKVVSQLYRKAKQEDLVIPALRVEGTEEQYEGATVIEPKKGYYKSPIATLDFASLYPSIMMAHNLCYSTLLKEDAVINQLKLARDKDYIITPSGDKFVKSTVKKGILPTILEDLLSARKVAKQDLKKETDPFKKAVLDGRQLALKISANSVYGFTGATVGKLPCLQVSQSVTAYGRQMIEFTKETVEKTYTVENGYKYDAEVVYGDTDSVMVKFGTEDLQEAMNLGTESAKHISSLFVHPIKLEFEKVYWPYLLINKKRYAGLYYTRTESFDKMDTKGLETVRRDNCRLVSTVVDTCLRKILIDRDEQGALTYAKNVIADLLQNKIDLSLLVITKQLSKSGEDYAGKQAHVELAERMRKRDAGSAPQMGDRVPYVIIKAAKGAPAYEKAEDPIFVLESNIPIDTRYYLENQLKNPLVRIFDPVFGTEMAAEQNLLTGEHTRTIQVTTSSSSCGLMKFAVRRMTCLGCKAVLSNQSDAVCKHCLPNINTIYMKNLEAFKDVENKFSRLWTQCQRCQGSLHQDVLCTSRDCPIFYMRKRVQKEATDSYNIIQRFGDGFSNWNEAFGVKDAMVQDENVSMQW